GHERRHEPPPGPASSTTHHQPIRSSARIALVRRLRNAQRAFLGSLLGRETLRQRRRRRATSAPRTSGIASAHGNVPVAGCVAEQPPGCTLAGGCDAGASVGPAPGSVSVVPVPSSSSSSLGSSPLAASSLGGSLGCSVGCPLGGSLGCSVGCSVGCSLGC